jgi:hypothetical protein
LVLPLYCRALERRERVLGAEHPDALGADKAYDAEDFVNELRATNATPHVARNTTGRSSAQPAGLTCLNADRGDLM